MMSVYRDVALTVAVAAPAATIWSLLRQFKDVTSWNPSLASSSLLPGASDGIGAIREVATKDGTVVREQLIELDDARRILSYKILPCSIPILDQHNRIVVLAGKGDGLTLVTFSARFRPADRALVNDVADMNGAAFIAAANGLGRHLGVDVYVVAIDL